MIRFSPLLATLLLCLVGPLAQANDPEQTIRDSLKAVQPNLEIQSVTESPVTGLHEAHLSGGRVLYFSTDGKHMLQGHLFSFAEGQAVNLTEQIKNRAVTKELNALRMEDMVVYSPSEVKTHITVFTDPECGYCQKLHEEMPALNDAGIEVRYLAFTHQGPGSSKYDALVNIWCAPDRQDAMNRAKRGKRLASAQCDNPVSAHYALGTLIGVQGTPAIILQNGQYISGYRPAAELIRLALAAAASDVQP